MFGPDERYSGFFPKLRESEELTFHLVSHRILTLKWSDLAPSWMHYKGEIFLGKQSISYR